MEVGAKGESLVKMKRTNCCFWVFSLLFSAWISGGREMNGGRGSGWAVWCHFDIGQLPLPPPHRICHPRRGWPFWWVPLFIIRIRWAKIWKRRRMMVGTIMSHPIIKPNFLSRKYTGTRQNLLIKLPFWVLNHRPKDPLARRKSEFLRQLPVLLVQNLTMPLLSFFAHLNLQISHLSSKIFL